MKSQLQPWHLLLLTLSGWINRRQQVVEYLLTGNQILREQLGKKRILLNDYQRRRLAIKCKLLGRKVLDELATIVTPVTDVQKHDLLRIFSLRSLWGAVKNYPEKRYVLAACRTFEE